MTLVERVRPAAGEPEGALVLLHGRGADENDLHGLLDQLDPAAAAGRRDAARRRCRCRPAARTGTPSTASASPIRRRSGRSFERPLRLVRRPAGAARLPGRPDRARRVLAGLRDVLRARPGRRAARAPRAARDVRLHAGRRRARARPRPAGSRGRDRARRRRPRDRRRLRPRGPGAARGHAGHTPLPRVRRRPLGRPRRPRWRRIDAARPEPDRHGRAAGGPPPDPG